MQQTHREARERRILEERADRVAHKIRFGGGGNSVRCQGEAGISGCDAYDRESRPAASQGPGESVGKEHRIVSWHIILSKVNEQPAATGASCGVAGTPLSRLTSARRRGDQ